MYAYLRGILAQATPSEVIVDVSGVGYRLMVPVNVFSKLPQIENPVLLYTSYVVREASQTLYGFLSLVERDLFELLLGVTGVGPKLALSLVGHLSVSGLRRAISQHDVVGLAKVPGIGKKTAERLIVEIRDKISSLLPPDPSEHAVFTAEDPRTQKISDAMSALINLGYTQIVAQKAIKRSLDEQSEEVELAKLITTALKHI